MSRLVLPWNTVAFCSEQDAFQDFDEEEDYDIDDIDFDEIDEVGELEDDSGELFPQRPRGQKEDNGGCDDDDDDLVEFDERMRFPVTDEERAEQDKLFELWFVQFHQRLVDQHRNNFALIQVSEVQKQEQQQQGQQQQSCSPLTQTCPI